MKPLQYDLSGAELNAMLNRDEKWKPNDGVPSNAAQAAHDRRRLLQAYCEVTSRIDEMSREISEILRLVKEELKYGDRDQRSDDVHGQASQRPTTRARDRTANAGNARTHEGQGRARGLRQASKDARPHEGRARRNRAGSTTSPKRPRLSSKVTLPELCAERDGQCMCQGGKHALCLTASRKNEADKSFLMSLGSR